MKAMILAAGYGKRMRPLTDHTPKPLLLCCGKPLIVYHIEALVAAGIKELVINHSYLGEQIEQVLGDGSQFGASIQYSAEVEPLETAGGIINALPLLGEQPFIICNGDVWTDFPFQRLLETKPVSDELAHLVMVENPLQHPDGDFFLDNNGRLSTGAINGDAVRRTYAGISLINPALFADERSGSLALIKPLLKAIAEGRVSGEYYPGAWTDVGTPQRLLELEKELQQRG